MRVLTDIAQDPLYLSGGYRGFGVWMGDAQNSMRTREEERLLIPAVKRILYMLTPGPSPVGTSHQDLNPS